MKILHISDIHFRRSYKKEQEGYKGMLYQMQSPLIPLEHCFRQAGKNHKIDLLVISGDLTEDGDQKDYSLLKRYIETEMAGIPAIVTLGNHDNKASFRIGWLGASASDAPYNQLLELDQVCLVSFDSSVQGNSNGLVTPAQLDWLEEVLDQVKEKPVLFITHHHLLENQSSIPSIPDTDRLSQILEKHHVIGILNGHTHHSYQGNFGKIPCYTTGGMSFCGEDEGNGMVRFEEVYGYNIYEVQKGELQLLEMESFGTGREIKTISMR